MFNQQDVDKIKAWLIDTVIKEVIQNTILQAKEKEKELVPDQRVSNSYSSFHTISGLERARVNFRARRGNVKGEQKISIRSSNRRSTKGKLYTVKAHERSYIDQRMWRLPDGKIIVLDHMPTSITVKLVKDSFYSALADRAEYFQGKSERI